jgi:hypothetical protein
MTQGQKLVITATLVTAVALASSTIMLTQGDPCGNHPVAVVAAPGGRQKAVIFDRGCGASSAQMGRMVSLLPSDAKFPADGEVGNAFRVDRAGVGGTAPIDVAASWESDSVLVIRHRPGAHVSFAVLRDRGVRIRYDTLP